MSELQKLADNVRWYFSNNNRFKWEKVIDNSASGLLSCFKESDMNIRDSRRFLIKCPQYPDEPSSE